ncbi:MAG: acyl-CoA dehydrogenase family protein [Eubacteriales bacterium]|jgi:butyryl-CoA dehydrogenase|nr:acyl-CoA dehydrogenase family protein [Eubacteriales bacterium]
MDFSLSQEQVLQQNLFRSIAEKEIKPIARDMDEEEVYSPELLALLQSSGLLGIPFSRRWGGVGADVLTYALCMEEVSKVDASTGITISVHTSLCCASIDDYGSEEQKELFLRPLVDGRKVGCFGLTEPGAGSDVAAGRTSATKQGDEYVINGVKAFTTNSGFADLFLVFAITDPKAGVRGMSAFLVDREAPGLHVSANIPRMGIRAASNCMVTYDSVRVPEINRLGREGDGFRIAMKALDGGRIGIGAQSVGIAQGAIEETLKYVRERKQFGKPISSFQNTQFQLASMQTRVDAARLLVWRAAWMKDQGMNYSKEAAMCKLFASEVANDVTRGCVQLFGGYGYSREYPVERMMRDAKITEIYEGTSEVMKMVIAGAMKVK